MTADRDRMLASHASVSRQQEGAIAKLKQEVADALAGQDQLRTSVAQAAAEKDAIQVHIRLLLLLCGGLCCCAVPSCNFCASEACINNIARCFSFIFAHAGAFVWSFTLL